ncbi:HEAT domain containing protein [Halorhabdus tiamatea SARL4B]|uniref:HEAT domain containing protein n=1 Tax=Halorhabdus tiamatea SARL4B TaxID=1033806 RepID=F7PKM6_9EURY|nr:hypothetical protein [Halorhabdus tiamatea]ERJ05955.1 HEAT domain containing protein [Halorhabdus tiamatea SARL4B]CCQ34011.1 HEAT domain containing protein [Halorhabdus tiamatea SARL4B]
MTDDPRERATALLREARADPDPDDAPAFDELLSADDPTLRRNGLDGLAILGGRDPSLLTDRVDRFAELLSDPDREVRAGASALYANSLSGDAVLEAADALAECLTDSYSIVRWNALEGLLAAARTDPAACTDFVDDVLAFLDADADHVRAHAVQFLAVVSTAHPEAVLPATDRLLDVLLSSEDIDVPIDATVRRRAPDSGSRVDDMADEGRKRIRDTRQAAGHAIYEVARGDPDAVRPTVDDLLELLDDPDPQIRVVALDVLVALAEDDPEPLTEYTEQIATCLDDDAAMVRASASQALTAVSPAAPDDVAGAAFESVDRIAPLLEDDDPAVRASAASLLALAAERDPDAVAGLWDRLEGLRSDDAAFVREAAADALDQR